MRGIAAGLGSVTVMLAGLGLCLVFAAYDAVRQGFSGSPPGGASVARVPREQTVSPSP